MSGVQYSRAVKIDQLFIRLTNLLINRKEENINIKLKTARKIVRITERHCWPNLYEKALMNQILKTKMEYYKLNKNSEKVRATYLKEISKEAAQKGNL